MNALFHYNFFLVYLISEKKCRKSLQRQIFQSGEWPRFEPETEEASVFLMKEIRGHTKDEI